MTVDYKLEKYWEAACAGLDKGEPYRSRQNPAPSKGLGS